MSLYHVMPLLKALLTAAGYYNVFGKSLRSVQIMSSNTIKVGIVGYGFSAKCFNLPFILPNQDLHVYAFLQRAAGPEDATRWGHCTVDFPNAKHYRTADDFFADTDIELVIVCTHTHEEFVERALKAGKHGQFLPCVGLRAG